MAGTQSAQCLSLGSLKGEYITRDERRTFVTGFVVVCLLLISAPAMAQSRGVYPLGMTSVNAGTTAGGGFTYSNQLLFYSRDAAKDRNGDTLPVTGDNAVLMDLNSFVWVSEQQMFGGARYSMTATLPFAKNELVSDIRGTATGGGGFADSFYLPFILGWNKEHLAVRVLYGFLAPTGRYAPNATDNVGSGYWTSTISSGQTFYVRDRRLVLSAYEMYEVHTTQEGTGTRPGDTFDLDYSVMATFGPARDTWQLQVGLAGYAQRQTTAHTGPAVTQAQSAERYEVNAIGFASSATFPNRRLTLGMRFFEEFANRSSFEGYSLQISGALGF